ncbi:MAG: thioredoxin family protein [Bacteroidales bacterium]
MQPAEFQSLLVRQPALMLYFYNDTCGVCTVLWPQVSRLMEERFPKIHLVRIEAAQSRELAGQLRMLSVPGMVLFLEGKEYFRATGNLSLGELETKTSRLYEMMFE